MKIEIAYIAETTKARPRLEALGSHDFRPFGPNRSATGRMTPTIAAISMAVALPAGSASNPRWKSSATAFHVATAGAGHSSVMSCLCGSGIRIR